MVTRVVSRRALCAASVASLSLPRAATALMAGDPPDSPTRRLDRNSADSPFAAVGSLTVVGGGVYSGVLVSRRHVLTAAHVVPPQANALDFHLNLDGDLTHTLAVRRAHVHPGWQGFHPPNPPNDLALLELATDAPVIVTPVRIGDRALTAGTTIELVGYGASGAGAKGVSVTANAALKRVGENVVDRVAGSGISGASGSGAALYFFTFDAPERPPYKRSSSLGNLRETGLASGDSGGPAFVRAGSQRLLAGINTFVQRRNDLPGPMFSFGSIGGGQIVHPHRAWIASIVGNLSPS